MLSSTMGFPWNLSTVADWNSAASLSRQLLLHSCCQLPHSPCQLLLPPTCQLCFPPTYHALSSTTLLPASSTHGCVLSPARCHWCSHSGLWGALSMYILQQQFPSRHQDKLTTQRFLMSIRLFSLLEISIWMNVEVNSLKVLMTSQVSFIVISLHRKEWNVMPHRTTVLHI